MFKSPARKLVTFFEKSRNGWKRKCQASRARCKYWANQARAVAKSRDEWRHKAEASVHELQGLRQELAALQKSTAG